MVDNVHEMARWSEANTNVRDPARLRAALGCWQEAGLLKQGATCDMADWRGHALKALQEGAIVCARASHPSTVAKMLGAAEIYGFVHPRLDMTQPPWSSIRPHGDTVAPDPRSAAIHPEWAGGLTVSGRMLVEGGQGGRLALVNALALRMLPSPLEPDWSGAAFNPFSIVLRVLLELERIGRNHALLSTAEMACVVQLMGGAGNERNAAHDIERARRRQTASQDREVSTAMALDAARNKTARGVVRASVLDYAKVAMSWYAATGLCGLGGYRGARTLVANPEPWARAAIAAIVSRPPPGHLALECQDYLQALALGGAGGQEPLAGADCGPAWGLPHVLPCATRRLVPRLCPLQADLFTGLPG